MISDNSKKLDNLSSQELGKLFPIIISEPNSKWKLEFEREKNELKRILGEKAIRIKHFGSTAIPNLKAKPTIDILVEILKNENINKDIIKIMKSKGYHFIPRNDCPPPYLMFVKGYTIEGFKGQVFHIYMAEKEHNGLWDRLFFRDYLIEHKDVAEKYENLKLKLAKKYKNDRDAYTNNKADFVKRITEKAKEKYK